MSSFPFGPNELHELERRARAARGRYLGGAFRSALLFVARRLAWRPAWSRDGEAGPPADRETAARTDEGFRRQVWR